MKMKLNFKGGRSAASTLYEARSDQPIVRRSKFGTDEQLKEIVRRVNAYDDLLAALSELAAHLPMDHRIPSSTIDKARAILNQCK